MVAEEKLRLDIHIRGAETSVPLFVERVAYDREIHLVERLAQIDTEDFKN